MPQAHLLTGAVDTDIYPTPPLGMRAVNQRLLFPLKKEGAVAHPLKKKDRSKSQKKLYNFGLLL